MPLDFDALMTQANTEKAQAVRRRVALVTAGCATYALKLMGPHEVIVCLCCAMWSPHPEDIAQRFCNFCHAFHTEWKDTPHA